MITPIMDQLNWRGVVNIQPGTILQQSWHYTSGSNTLYTVPANLTLFITWYYILYAPPTSGGNVAIQIHDANGNLSLYLKDYKNNTQVQSDIVCSLSTPLEVKTGYTITMGFTGTGSYCSLSLQGFLI